MRHKEYLCQYSFGGGIWGFTLKAASLAEAEERIKRLSLARVLGEQFVEIPAIPGGHLIARAILWLRQRRQGSNGA